MSGNVGGSSSKGGLGPLVECPEATDGPDPDLEKGSLRAQRGSSPSKSTENGPSSATSTKHKDKEDKRKRGSRLSLASLFSLGSTGAQQQPQQTARERSRSGWSCEEGATAGATMSSVSTSDLRSNGSGSLSNKRYRGSCDADSCQEVGIVDSASLLGDDVDDETVAGVSDSCRKKRKMRECPLCCMKQPISNFPRLIGCPHRSCRLCLMQYVELEIMENRVEVSCPECNNDLHPLDIKQLVGSRNELMEKYEQFSVRKYLLGELDARFCPAPDCRYAVIASHCAACPQLKCDRESCGTLFCYHCKSNWHANQTCDEARKTRMGGLLGGKSRGSRRMTSDSLDMGRIRPGDVKACPRCHTLIVKMDDGSCNHMVCALCSAEFCWLCLKEISDLHYLSPTGCTFWGKKPWTRKKKLLWQLGTLIGAPVGIALIAGLSIPGIIIGVPVFVGRKVHQRFRAQTKLRRRTLTVACVTGSLIVSPVLAVMAVGVGVPIMLAYVYGVVPLSLCRNGGCGLGSSDSKDREDDDHDDDVEQLWHGSAGHEKAALLTDADRQTDGTSIAPGLSIQSGMSGATTHHVRLAVHPDGNRRHSMDSGLNSLGERNYEEASTHAMAGSRYHYYYDDKSVHTVCSAVCDDVASTKALAGSVIDSKSLSESTGKGGRHEHGCEENHSCACATPSTSSIEHKSQSDDVGSTTVRQGRKTEVKPKTVNMIANVHAATEDCDEMMLTAGGDGNTLEMQPCSSRMMSHSGYGTVPHAQEQGSGVLRFSSCGSGDPGMLRGDEDPFKIRALLDNMKQMVAADEPTERPFVPVRNVGTIGRVRRSGSGKSLVTVATFSSSAADPHIKTEISSNSTVQPLQPKPKRGFLSSLFSKK